MLKLNSWKSDLKTKCFMMFLFSIVFVMYNPSISKPYNTHQYTSIHSNTHQYTSIHINTHQYTSIHINTHQYTSIHINTHQYTSIHFVVDSKKETKHSTCSTIFWVSVVASAALPVPSGGGRVALRGDNDIVMAASSMAASARMRHLLRTVPGAVAAKSGDRWIALHGAASSGHVEICRVLLAAGAEVDARTDEGLSALKRWRHGALGRFQGDHTWDRI